MLCPLNMLLTTFTSGRTELNKLQCLGAECAWFVEATCSCAVQQLPLVLSGLADVIEEIRQYMPHEEQFRK